MSHHLSLFSTSRQLPQWGVDSFSFPPLLKGCPPILGLPPSFSGVSMALEKPRVTKKMNHSEYCGRCKSEPTCNYWPWLMPSVVGRIMVSQRYVHPNLLNL